METMKGCEKTSILSVLTRFTAHFFGGCVSSRFVKSLGSVFKFSSCPAVESRPLR